MSDSTRRGLLYGALALLYALHNDLWLWSDARLVFGLPIGLAYHVGYCLAASMLLAAVVRWAWPDFADGDSVSPVPPVGDSSFAEGGSTGARSASLVPPTGREDADARADRRETDSPGVVTLDDSKPTDGDLH